jgi:hypothetical protein
VASSSKEMNMPRILWAVVVLLAVAPGVSAQTQDLILPIALNGYTVAPAHYQTIIRIVNMSPSPAQVTLEAYTNEGTPIRILELFPIGRSGTKTVFEIEAGGSVEAFTAEDVPALNGWIRLTFDAAATIQASAEAALINAPVGPHPICIRPSTEIVTSAQTTAVAAAQKFSGFAVLRPYRKSGFAIVNPSATQNATVFLSLMDFAGRLVSSATLELKPQARVSRFVHELMPGAPADFMGSIRFTGTIPVAVGGVNVLFPEGKFSNNNVSASPAMICSQVVAPARNPLTSECRVFPTPCAVPDGWIRVSACPISQ